MPKEPSSLNPFRNHDRAVERRNYVIGRMEEDGYITAKQANAARAEPLVVNPRVLTPNSIAAGFFAEEVRRELQERYGEQKLYEGGLSVRTTLDPKIQLMARKALVDGLVRYDEAYGWHGTLKTIDISQDWGVPLADIPAYGDIKPWVFAVALDVSDRPSGLVFSPSETNPARRSQIVGLASLRLKGRAGRAAGPKAWSSLATSSTSSRSPATRATIACARSLRSPAPP